MNVSRLGLVVDFDGTIAEIAPTPDEARYIGGVRRDLGPFVPEINCGFCGIREVDRRLIP